MPNTSATGGYLAPAASPAPLEGQDFNRFLQQVLVGVSGLAGALVRPRWQIEPPNQPDIETTWLAFGITTRRADAFPYVAHDGAADGADTMQRHETVEVLLSFYGPDADAACEVVREGLQVSTNRRALFDAGMAIVETGDATTVPSIVKERFQYRVDMPLTLRRAILRQYPVLNLLSAGGTIQRDQPAATEPFLATD